jgi:signal transduction histidine kinase
MEIKDKIIYVLVIGVLSIVGFIVIGDFTISLRENRPVDEKITDLLQIVIIGLIGIVSGYFGAKNKN